MTQCLQSNDRREGRLGPAGAPSLSPRTTSTRFPVPRPGLSLARLWGHFSRVPAEWPWLGTPIKATEKTQRRAGMCAPGPIPPSAQRVPPSLELTPCKVLGPVAGDRGRQKGDTSQQPRQAETSHPRTWGGRGIRHRWFETQSPTRSTGSPSLNSSLTEPSWGGTRFSETGAPGRTCGRPRPQEATPRSRPLERFTQAPPRATWLSTACW